MSLSVCGDHVRMQSRWPTRIWRMLSEELWRLAALTLAAITAIVSFAAAVRPLSEGQISLFDALHYAGLAIIPMLQITAPFAAGFASTLVYHRFASENEHLAASAGGISHRASLAPALGLGLSLALVVAGLSHFVIPAFLRSMKQIISEDVAQVLMSSIERGEPVELNGLAIHADRAVRGKADPARGVAARLFLQGVVAFDSDESGDVVSEVVAERAEVLLSTELREGDTVTVVHMLLDDAVGRNADEGLARMGRVRLRPWIVPNAFEDTPNFLTTTRLLELARHPDRDADVDRARRALAGELAVHRAERLLVAAISGESRIVLESASGDRVAIRAGEANRDREGAASRSRWKLSPISADGVEVDRTTPNGARASQLAELAWITFRADDAGDAAVTLELEQVGVRREGASAGQASRQAVRTLVVEEHLHLAGAARAAFDEFSSTSLLTEAERVIGLAPDDAGSTRVRASRDALAARIDRLGWEIVGNINERSALAVCCLLMTLVGAIIALRLRDGAPLQVYLWSFFPALASVVTISGGERAVPGQPLVGLLTLWGGAGALVLYALYEYMKLRRH